MCQPERGICFVVVGFGACSMSWKSSFNTSHLFPLCSAFFLLESASTASFFLIRTAILFSDFITFSDSPGGSEDQAKTHRLLHALLCKASTQSRLGLTLQHWHNQFWFSLAFTCAAEQCDSTAFPSRSVINFYRIKDYFAGYRRSGLSKCIIQWII